MAADNGKSALWVCSAMLGLLRAKGVIGDGDIMALARSLDDAALATTDGQESDIRLAADWLRHCAEATNE